MAIHSKHDFNHPKQASKFRSDLIPGLLFLLLGAGCSATSAETPQTSGEEEVSASRLPLTDVIPTSANCNLGHGPSRCIHVPLIPPPGFRDPEAQPHQFVMDGIRGEQEWSGAVQLAYSNETSKAGDGKIFLALPQSTSNLSGAAGAILQTDMVLFFENFPVDTRAAPNELGIVRVYIDYQRFTGADERISTNDRLFEFDIISGVPKKRLNGTSSGDWVGASLSGISVSTTTNHCKPDPSTNKLLRCNAEVKISLNPQVTIKPEPLSSVLPGFGLLITDGQTQPLVDSISSYPTNPPAFNLALSGRQVQRTAWETILIGRPRGFPLKFMSWNVRRFKSASLKGPFDKVENGDIGKFLALNDVVAIQEGWDTASIMEIWEHANVERDAHGLPRFRAPYAPPTVTSPEKQGFLEQAVAFVQGESEVHGGLWIFSHLPAKVQGQWVFQKSGSNPKPYCKGEDCFKAKGVQWVRLNLNPADGPAASCNQTPKDIDLASPIKEIAASCPPSPSGDHFVDIFNTHLQASGGVVCESDIDDIKDFLEGAAAAAAAGAAVGVGTLIKGLLEDELGCEVSDADIRREQIRQLNAFIEDTAREKDRPSIIMGDFNLDGKNIQDGEYNDMIRSLRIGPDTGDEDPPSDIINPWRFDFDDDFDHGDVLRERSDIPQVAPFSGSSPDSFKPVGTMIGEDIGEFVTQASPLATDVDKITGNERFDFILIRPPFRPESPEFKTSRWVALRPQADADVWSSPWPGEKDPAIVPGGHPPLAPERFSDHKPVVSTIELTQLSQPPVYHPSWKHDWEYRVTSANAAGIGDCAGWLEWASEDCKNIDLYNYIASATVEQNTSDLVFVQGPDKNTAKAGELGYCNEQSVVHFSSNTCTHDWFIAGKHTSVVQISHDGSSSLLDYDPVNNDGVEVLPRNSEDNSRFPWVKTIWDAPDVKNRGQIEFLMGDTDFLPSLWEKWSATIFVEDGAPVGACTKNSIPYVCIENSFRELPPGEQF